MKDEFHPDFEERDKAYFKEKGISPTQANQYGSRFRANEIEYFINHDHPPEEVHEYDAFFPGYCVAYLVEGRVTAKQANRHKGRTRFKPNEIVAIERAIRSTDIIRKPKWFMQHTLESIYSFSERFDASDIESMMLGGVPPEIAEKYDPTFNGASIADMFAVQVSPDDANSYPDCFTGPEIATLKLAGITLADVNDNIGHAHLLKKAVWLIKSFHAGYFFTGAPDRFHLIATGGEGLIIQWGNDALKISENTAEEYAILKNIALSNDHLENVVRCFEPDPFLKITPGSYIPLELITGETLGEALEQGSMSPSEVIHNAACILNGILEIRRAGYFHRDLHESNVMLDMINNRAVIIDLSSATDDPSNIHRLNRAYGGNNDLISLGQLMYKMATGRNLFNEGVGPTRQPSVKAAVKTERDKTYADPRSKQEMLHKVCRELDERPLLADIIMDLLDDDLWTQPSKDDVCEALTMLISAENHVSRPDD